MNNKDQRKQAQLKMSSLMFAVELTLTCIDEVEKLCIYRQGVKQAANNLKKALLPDLDKGYFDLYQQDPNLVSGISNKLEDLANIIGRLDIGQMCAVAENIPELVSKENEVKLLALHS